MDFNWFALIGATLVPLVVGFAWYHPKVFGNVWMRESGVTPGSGQTRQHAES